MKDEALQYKMKYYDLVAENRELKRGLDRLKAIITDMLSKSGTSAAPYPHPWRSRKPNVLPTSAAAHQLSEVSMQSSRLVASSHVSRFR